MMAGDGVPVASPIDPKLLRVHRENKSRREFF